MGMKFLLPKLGVEMEGAHLTAWLVAEGAQVMEGEALASVETDKVETEISAPSGGVVRRIAEEGVEYSVGDLLAIIAADRTEYDQLARPELATRFEMEAADNASGRGGAGSDRLVEGRTSPGGDTEGEVSADPEGAASSRRQFLVEVRRGEPLASPVARRVASAHSIDLNTVESTGERGVIRRGDVERSIELQGPFPREEPEAGGGRMGLDNSGVLSPLRRTIAARMHRSVQETAQMTDVREHDAGPLMRLRAFVAGQEEESGYRVSMTGLMVKAAALALLEVGELNASLEGDRLIVHHEVNIGVAVAISGGLVVPVVRGADRRGMRAIHEQIYALVRRARDRTLSQMDIEGGTFTVTNFGSYGSHFGTPILIPGQVGILGIGAVTEKPVVRDGRVEVGQTVHTSLTVDHRVVDGESAGRFQNTFADIIGDPARMMEG